MVSEIESWWNRFIIWTKILRNWPLRILERYGLAGGPLTYQLRNGLVMKLQGGSKDSDSLILWDIYVNTPYTRPPVKIGPDDTIIDIGAHVGLFATWAAKNSPGVTVYAYEAHPRNFRYLKENLVTNKLNNVYAFNLAVSEHVGEIDLFIHQRGTGGNSIVKDRFQQIIGTESLKVKSVTLDMIIKTNSIKRIDLLKLDCEGAEYGILLKAHREDLQMTKQIAAECHRVPGHSISELSQYLTQNNFQVELDPGKKSMLYAWKI